MRSSPENMEMQITNRSGDPLEISGNSSDLKTSQPSAKGLGFDSKAKLEVLFSLYFFLSTCIGIAFSAATTINTGMPPFSSIYSQTFMLFMDVGSIMALCALIGIIRRNIPRGLTIFTIHKISFHMRVAFIILSLGIMIFYFLVLIEPVEAAINGYSFVIRYKVFVHYAIAAIVVLLETYIIFKYNQVSIHSNIILAVVCLAHLSANALTQFAYTLVYDALHLSRKNVPYKKLATKMYTSIEIYINMTGLKKAPKIKKSTAFEARDYLTSFVGQHSLLAWCVLVSMFLITNSATDDADKVEDTTNNAIVEPAPHTNIRTKLSKCHRGNRGLLLGLLMSSIMLCFLIASFIYTPKSEYETVSLILTAVYSAMEILGFCLTIGAIVRFSNKIHRIPHSRNRSTRTMEGLLVFTLCSFILYVLFFIIAYIDTFKDIKSKYIAGLSLVKNIVNLLQAIGQTGFILDALHRHVKSTKEIKVKSGRTILTLLIFYNLIIWISQSARGRVDDMNSISDYYGYNNWGIIVSFFSPICLLYRLLSLVALSSIWSKAYRT